MEVISAHVRRLVLDQPRVVIGYDDSAVAVRALGWAVREAHRLDAILEIVVAWRARHPAADHYGSQTEYARTAAFGREALRLAHRIDPQVNARLTHHRGSAGRLLVRRSHGALMVVLGTHSHLGIVGALIGSTARYVTRHSTVPVSLVGPDSAVETEQRIVVTATDSQIAPSVLSWAVERANQSATARMHIIDTVETWTTWTTPSLVDEPARQLRARQAEEWHADLVAVIRGLAPLADITTELLEGRPDVVAARLTAEDLVVLGIHDRHQRFELWTAPCPVVLVPERHSASLTTRHADRPAPRATQVIPAETPITTASRNGRKT
ncbi:universal stress protein [Angustibacter sp. McL0619]|uniref:universal stress protein n=1 Tax=Angustibacter sp. McL0619 TaxID=3415676 RepID=UPI003CF2B3BB